MMPEVKMRLDKLRFSISEGLGFAEGRLGESVALTAIFRDLEVRAKELEDAMIGEDLKSLALHLGFAWPEDDAGRWRVLKTMAGMASHWRAKYNEVQAETWRDVERERMYQHMRRRAVSLAAKVTNLRRCLRDYMAGQRVAVAEARAELMAARGK